MRRMLVEALAFALLLGALLLGVWWNGYTQGLDHGPQLNAPIACLDTPKENIQRPPSRRP